MARQATSSDTQAQFDCAAASLLTEACAGDSARGGGASQVRVQPAGRPGGPLQLDLSFVPLCGPIRLRLGLRLALDSPDILGAGLLLGLACGDALCCPTGAGLEFVQPGSAVTWLAEVSGGFFVSFGFRLTRDSLRPRRVRGFCLIFWLGNTIRGGLAVGFYCFPGLDPGDVAEEPSRCSSAITRRTSASCSGDGSGVFRSGGHGFPASSAACCSHAIARSTAARSFSNCWFHPTRLCSGSRGCTPRRCSSALALPAVSLASLVLPDQLS